MGDGWMTARCQDTSVTTLGTSQHLRGPSTWLGSHASLSTVTSPLHLVLGPGIMQGKGCAACFTRHSLVEIVVARGLDAGVSADMTGF